MQRTREQLWYFYQKVLLKDLRRGILFLCCGAMLQAITIIFVLGKNQFVYINAGFAILPALLFVFHTRVDPNIIIGVLLAFGFLNAILSYFWTGLLGSGSVILFGTQLLAIIFLKLRGAVVVLVLQVVILVVFGTMVHSGRLVFPPSIANRINEGGGWVSNAVLLVIFFVAVTMIVHRLRKSLINGQVEIERTAFTDPLTGLLNRNGCSRRIDERIGSGISCAVLVLADLHNFRAVNVLYGTDFGDQILQIISGALQDLSPKATVLGRLSGVEFGVWFETDDRDGLIRNIEQTRSTVFEDIRNKYGVREIKLHGAAVTFPDDGKTFDELFSSATVALTRAKEDNAREIVRFHHGLSAVADRQMRFSSRLHTAVEMGSFSLAYQGQVEISSGNFIGVEALARWTDVEFGVVSPDDFIPGLTREHLIDPFSRYIIKKVLGDVAELRAVYPHLQTISINVSPVVLLRSLFPYFILDACRQADVEPYMITLEVTEDVFVDNINGAREVLSSLKDEGFQIALDDFGTGFSSLSVLHQMPLNELKVDRSFVERIDTDPQDRLLFSVICTIGRTFGYRVVSEGVETAEQLKIVKESGCTVVQGYLFSRPTPLSQLLEAVSKS